MKSFGFTAVVNNGQSQLKEKVGFAYSQKIENEKLACYGHFINKFIDDKIFRESDDYVLLLDGVVLNKKHLLALAKETDWFSYLITQYKKKGDTFFEALRGSFAGLLIDKRKNRSILFTDHIGSKFMYYTLNGDSFACSTMIAHLYAIRHTNQLRCTLSEQGAIMLLTYGFMLKEYTLCDEIKKVQPGCYVLFENGKTKEHRYCMLDNTPDNSLSESDAIELYDQEFRRAVALQFEKDIEGGAKKHLVSLSGGLDCRMTSWVAHDMGYTNQLNITFSQTDYWDETIPKQIAADLRHEWLFKALDNGLWLYNLDNVLEVTGGNVLYYGQAHGMSLFKYLSFEELGGLCHTGQLGDVILATHMRSIDTPYSLGVGAYSTKYIDKLSTGEFADYPNYEIGFFYSRCFSGANNGLLVTMSNVETVSPHSEWDAMNAFLKVPPSMRYNHNIYIKWILAKYPKAADYVWEAMSAKITSPTFTIAGHTLTMNQWKNVILQRLHLQKSGIESKQNMNPVGYYLQTNPELRHFIDSNLLDANLIANKTISKIVFEIINTGTSMEKIQAVTLVRAVKLFGLE